jgi:6-phosphogluconolactonase
LARAVKERGVLRRLLDPHAVALEGALEFVRSARSTLEQGDSFSVALAGGSTPRAMLRLLAEEPLRNEVEWARVLFIFGDERLVPPGHDDSNFRMAKDALFSKLDLREDQVHRIHGECDDPEVAAAEYEAVLRDSLGVDERGKRLGPDLFFLGMGEDGHTASLFPGTTALNETRRWVVANEVPELETTRITLTYPALTRARRVVFMACGTSKASRLVEVFDASAGGDVLPAARVSPRSGVLIWLVDEAAAADLN